MPILRIREWRMLAGYGNSKLQNEEKQLQQQVQSEENKQTEQLCCRPKPGKWCITSSYGRLTSTLFVFLSSFITIGGAEGVLTVMKVSSFLYRMDLYFQDWISVLDVITAIYHLFQESCPRNPVSFFYLDIHHHKLTHWSQASLINSFYFVRWDKLATKNVKMTPIK